MYTCGWKLYNEEEAKRERGRVRRQVGLERCTVHHVEDWVSKHNTRKRHFFAVVYCDLLLLLLLWMLLLTTTPTTIPIIASIINVMKKQIHRFLRAARALPTALSV